MFSVNIDKIAKISSKEEESFNLLIEKITEDNCKTIAVVNGGVDTIKLATVLSYPQNKTLFIDGDFRKETFLGKYKLGKNIKGMADALLDNTVLDGNICVTNNPYLDILFTGDSKDIHTTEDAVNGVLDKVSDQYKYIIIDSDESADIAKECNVTVLMCDEKSANDGKAEGMVKELDEKGCFVLGVIINE